MTLPEAITAGVTTGHVAHHVELHDWKNATNVVNVKTSDYGAVGDGVTNDTAAIAAAVDDCPDGGVVYLPAPAGNYITDSIVIDKAITLRGDGRFASVLAQRTDVAAPVIDFQLPSTSPSIYRYYGPQVVNLGIEAKPLGTGIRMGIYAYWYIIADCFVQSGAIGIDGIGGNGTICRTLVADCGVNLDIDGDTGLELILSDVVLARNSVGTTSSHINVICATAGQKGAVWMTNVRTTSGYTGGVSSSRGMLVSAPSLTSVPVFATGVNFDNVTGPGLVLENVSNIKFDNGWINTAAATEVDGPPVRITGGEDLQFRGNSYYGGALNPRTYDFVGGSTDFFLSEDNYCPTGPTYYLPATGKPTNMRINDRVPGATGFGHITNDIPGLSAAIARRWSEPDKTYRREEGGAAPYGYATFAGGSPNVVTVAHTGVNVNTRVRVVRERSNGPAGHIYSSVANNVVGTSFQVFSDNSADLGSFYWEMYESI